MKSLERSFRALLCIGILCIGILIGTPALAAPEVDIDFSTCGYRQSSVAIPLVPIRAVVTEDPAAGDDAVRIQAAIDYVAGLEADASGFRGAVLLRGRSFTAEKGLVIRASGIVLRGCGVDQTSLRGTSVMREPLIRIVGKSDLNIDAAGAMQVIDETVAAGAKCLTLADATGFAVGERIMVTRPCTTEWIKFLGMDRTGIAWKPGSRDIRWERRIAAIDGDRIELDAPITTALEMRFGGARVEKFSFPGRISNVGVENLQLTSAGVTKEDRPWCGVTIEHAEDAWVRQVNFSGFSGSAVALWESAKNISVQDCISEAPVSEIGGTRFSRWGSSRFSCAAGRSKHATTSRSATALPGRMPSSGAGRNGRSISAARSRAGRLGFSSTT